MKRRIGIIPDAHARPLFTPFQSPGFDITVGTPGELAMKLREDNLDGAFLSPVDAARHRAGHRLAPGNALIARAGSQTAHLVFREGLETISTIAADPGRSAEIVLAHLVLVEKYDTTPQILPLADDSHTPPHGADALLLTGDVAHSLPDGTAGLFVREDRFTGDDLGLFSSLPATGNGDSGSPVSFLLDDEARAGLAEFLQMAFYHGILKEIPEFKVLGADPPR
jgi:hypothetical protein